MHQLEQDAAEVRAAVVRATAPLVDRDVLGEVVALCAVAREHLLVIGPPGTGKSEAVRRVAGELGGSYFEYLLGRFTEPNEIFGPIDLRKLREGVVEVQTAGMLPEADVVFLDEIFLGSTAILNTLLGILNERTYRRGATVVQSPLRVCVGAANRLPDDPALDAFADRFLARVFVEPISDARLEELLEAGSSSDPDVPRGTTRIDIDALDRLHEAARTCDLSPARQVLATALRTLRGAGLNLTDRRLVRVQRLVAAAAVLDGRASASARDFWVIPLVATTPDAQATARESLSTLLDDAGNAGLVNAAEEFSRGRAARAERLRSSAATLLAGPEAADHRLRIEAVLRELDATFEASDLSPELATLRNDLVQRVAEDG